MGTASLRLFSVFWRIKLPFQRQQQGAAAHKDAADTAAMGAACARVPLTPLTFRSRSGEGEERKCERFGGLSPPCWKGAPVQDPHHTDSRLVLGGARADGARLTLMCDSAQSSLWIHRLPPPNGPLTLSLQPILALQAKVA